MFADPVALIALQVLNAWFVRIVAGVGLTLFQELIPRPGLASGLYANTRRVGAIVSGPIIGLASLTALGYQGVFAACAALTVLALVILRLTGRRVRLDDGPAPGPVVRMNCHADTPGHRGRLLSCHPGSTIHWINTGPDRLRGLPHSR